MIPTEALFRTDAYLTETDATVLAVNERGGIVTDRTVFYATSGGQPGDSGRLVRADGSDIAIATTVTGETKDEIIHVPAPGQALPAPGEAVRLAIDWPRRLKLMRMHTACHLLTSSARSPSPAPRSARRKAGSISTYRKPAIRARR